MNDIVDAEVTNVSSKFKNPPFIVAILVILLSGAYAIWMLSGQPAAAKEMPTKFVVLNSTKLVAASTKQIMDNKALSPEQVGEVSKKLAINIRKLVDSYREEGYVVLNANAVLSAPAEMDITATFAKQLGVKLD